MAEAAQAVGACTVVNGSDSTDHVEEYLRHGFEFTLLGEAEWTLLELVESLLGRAKREPESVPGLAFLSRKTGVPIRTAPRLLIKNLDALPFPARDLIDAERYLNAWKSAHGFFSLNLVASRGCPYQCNWCSKPIYGNSFHLRSAESVADEMLELKQTHRAEHLWFADDIFGLKARWILELAEAVERRNAMIPFKVQSRVDLMTPPSVAALQRAGCTEVWMGVESGSQKILDAMDKGTTVEQIITARTILRREGIRACYFLQFGYPGENWEDIQKTIRLVRQTRPDDIGVSVSYPLPGTKFHERVREELGEKTNWVDSEDLAMMFKGAYTNEFYRALHDALHVEVGTWNSNNGQRSGSKGVETGEARAPSVSLGELWARVEELEAACRNSEPTLMTRPESVASG